MKIESPRIRVLLAFQLEDKRVPMNGGFELPAIFVASMLYHLCDE
jgi:hypothetical protein